MPSQLHECLLLLFRNRPSLAAELLREVLQVELPHYTEARVESAELTQVQPAEYRADLVILLDAEQRPLFGIVVEVQLAPDEDKRFTWPVYAVDLRARKRCPVCVLVFTAYESVARWAAKPIELGAGNLFSPLVIGPSAVPAVIDPGRASAEPELAVLSAMAHGNDSDTDSVLRIAMAAMAASVGLDPARSMLYCDRVLASLSDAARKALLAMDPAKYEFQSDFAQLYLSQGRAEGRTEGAAGVLIKQLTLKFGPLSQAHSDRIHSASLEELDVWTERVLTAAALVDVLR